MTFIDLDLSLVLLNSLTIQLQRPRPNIMNVVANRP